MFDHRRYLAEEVAVDHADGILDRRRALHLLGLMGFSLAGATSLLAACSGGGTGDVGSGGTTVTPGASSTTAGGSGSSVPAGVPTQNVTYPGRTGTLQGAWAAAGRPRGAVLVVHENRGLTDHIRSVAGRLAADGFSALAPDLLSEEGGTTALGDPDQATAALNAAPPQRFVDDLRSGVDELARRQPDAKLGAIGFCFGGGLVWRLLDAGEPRLAAAAPFYGPAPDNPDFSRSKAAVLAVYAALDSRINASRPKAESALRRAGLPYEIRTFPGVDHAFFNDTGPRYDAEQAAVAYRAVLDWFGRHLA